MHKKSEWIPFAPGWHWGFEAELFDAALGNLDDRQNPLRFNNFAYSVRETVRHVLKRLAPDREVQRSQWYQNETESQKGVTRRQCAHFAAQRVLSDDYVKNSLGRDTDADHKALGRAIDELSKYTPIEPATCGVPDPQVEALAEQTVSAVAELLERIALAPARLQIIARITQSATGSTGCAASCSPEAQVSTAWQRTSPCLRWRAP